MLQSLPSIRSAVAQPLRALLRTRLVDALTTPHGVDRYLELLDPAWSLSEVRATVVAVQLETPDCATLTLRPNASFTGHEPGQFVQLGVEIAGVRHTRCFSIASSARRRDGLLTVTVKVNGDGLVSRFVVHGLAPGAVVVLSQAQGEFMLPAERPRRLLFISGGSGITPVMSMLRTLRDEGYDGEVTFLHYARSAEALIFRDELAALASEGGPRLRIVRAFTRGPGGELAGHFRVEHLETVVPDFASHETFLCGPGPLMEAVNHVYQARGLEARLHQERFTLELARPAPASPDAAPEGAVHFARSSVHANADGRSLLDQAESAGLKPLSGCRMGICQTCKCRKLSGTVRDLRTGLTSDAPDEEIQICVTAPVGDVTLDL